MRSRRSSRDWRNSTADDGDDSDPYSTEDSRGECDRGQWLDEKRGTLSPVIVEDRDRARRDSVDSARSDARLLSPSSPGSPPQNKENMEDVRNYRRSRLRSSWTCTWATLAVVLLSVLTLYSIVKSFRERHCDVKGCGNHPMRPSYLRMDEFDTEHTRFASKYSLHLYREHGIDTSYPPKGVPVLFIPGNAGSFKQVRSMAAEAARYWRDSASRDENLVNAGARNLDFFTVDFNEDFTAFHGQTMLDQAEYLNEAVAYILSLYHDSRKSTLDSDIPDPTSVMIFAHSMGGIVARTMLIMPNYQANSINTIITMSAPHARPPASFDGQIVKTYDDINNYWRKSFSEKWANQNPLYHVTLVSIAGGGLDSVVPSDYASISSLVPDTHGFTVFTSSIPKVWMGIDHLAILWCDQLMKVVARAMTEIVDVNRAGQTKNRADRMRILKKWFLTGMEPVAEKELPHKEPTTLLTLEDNSHSIISLGQRFELRELGEAQKPKAYLMPIPPSGSPGSTKFTLLTDQQIDQGKDGKLEVLFCSVFPLKPGQTEQLFSMNMDLSGDTSGSTRLACKNAADDIIRLPASHAQSKQPFDESESPFSYLQYRFEDIAEHQFVAVVDKTTRKTSGWVLAEFIEQRDAHMQSNVSLSGLVMDGVQTTLPADRTMVTDLNIPVIHSSLLAYKLTIGHQVCGEVGQLFSPLVRQYLDEPYESKYFVNVKKADINLHGTAPYLPPALRPGSRRGLSLQIWSDPTCNSSIEVSLQLDLMGSLGRLYMRYRTVLGAFPLLIVALVMRIQFREYDTAGRFMSFNEGLDHFVSKSLLYLLGSLSLMTLSLAFSNAEQKVTYPSPLDKDQQTSTALTMLAKNDMLVGLQDPVFWFLAPLFAVATCGVVIVLNYGVMMLLHCLTSIYGLFIKTPSWISNERRRAGAPAFSTSNPRRRIMTTVGLLFFVATVIPYQFAYMVACIVQFASCIRALRYAKENGHERSGQVWDFYHYTHSVLIIMLWILPINLPVLVVWGRNLAVHWMTPFSSHHNLLSIMPFILLVETLTTGNMVPRITTGIRHLTTTLLLVVAAYSALYGVTYAYQMHQLVNILAAWLVALHFSTTRPTLSGLIDILVDGEEESNKKRHS